MNTNIIQPSINSLYELTAYKFVTNLKSANLNAETLNQLKVPMLVARDITKIINEEVISRYIEYSFTHNDNLIFKDIQSRSIIIKQYDAYDEKDRVIREQTSKLGPAFLPDTFKEGSANNFIRFERAFYYFVNSPNFCHNNKIMYRYVSTKLIKLHNSNIDLFLIQGILTVIDTIDVLKIYKNNKLNTMQNIIEIIKLVETKKITDGNKLYFFSDEIYALAGQADDKNLDLYPSFLKILSKLKDGFQGDLGYQQHLSLLNEAIYN